MIILYFFISIFALFNTIQCAPKAIIPILGKRANLMVRCFDPLARITCVEEILYNPKQLKDETNP